MVTTEDAVCISVIVPTYKRPEKLLETLNSLVLLPEITEIIVINDSPEIPVTFQNLKVKVLANPHNLGEAAAINNGFNNFSNRYFAIISDDDPQTQDWLPNIVKALREHSGYIAYYPSTRIIRGKGVERTIFAKTFNRIVFLKTLKAYCLAGVVIDRHKLPRSFNKLRQEGVIFPNDLIQWLELSKFGDFFAVPNSFANWVSHPSQLTNTIEATKKSYTFLVNLMNWSQENQSKLSPSLEAAIFLRSLQFLNRGLGGKFQDGMRLFKYTYNHSRNKIRLLIAIFTTPLMLASQKFLPWKK